jgi:hypothetical protein
MTRYIAHPSDQLYVGGRKDIGLHSLLQQLRQAQNTSTSFYIDVSSFFPSHPSSWTFSITLVRHIIYWSVAV